VSAVEDGSAAAPFADGEVRLELFPNVEEVADGYAQGRGRFGSIERALDFAALLLAKGHFKLLSL